MNFTSPYAFKDMQKSVERIIKAIETQEKIVIWGDFDADGVTSTCLLFKTLEHLGANVEYYIPSRHKENHGLNSNAIVKFLTKKVKLFITVDCASNDEKEISLIKSFNADVIVTDHHDIPAELPEAEVLLNPKLETSGYPFRELCGAGVAMKLAVALGAEPTTYLGFAAVATVCDIVTLLEENRTIVKLGLQQLHQCSNLGLNALAEGNQLRLSAINTGDIGYRIGPCINASGRLASADLAMQLLLAADETTAMELASELIRLNEERKEKTQSC
mgnify:CR=1 FL=1